MTDIVKIALVFVVILIFLRLKWHIGYVMLIATGVLFLLYLVPFPVIFSTVRTALTDVVTIKLFFALSLIRVLTLKGHWLLPDVYCGKEFVDGVEKQKSRVLERMAA